jgi:hypothetical protein
VLFVLVVLIFVFDDKYEVARQQVAGDRSLSITRFTPVEWLQPSPASWVLVFAGAVHARLYLYYTVVYTVQYLVSGFGGSAYYSTSLALNILTSKVYLFSLTPKAR